MATRVIDDSKLQNIAVAIQAKDNGGQMTVDEMSDRIEALPDDSQFIDLCAGTNVNFSNDRITTYNSNVFRGNTNLISISLPNLTTISNEAMFSDCTNLISANLPKVTTFKQQEFYHCSNLISVNLPELIYAGWQMTFLDCKGLTEIYLPKVNRIGHRIFENCVNLQKIILNSRATLLNVNAVSNCPAIFYVLPEDLSWYSTATNWSTLYAQNRIKSIEDLTGDDLVWYQEQLARYQAA